MKGFTALLVVLILVACQSGGAQVGVFTQRAIPSEIGVGPRATFAVATTDGLLGLDANGSALGRIVSLPPRTMPSSPALQPGTKTIFFVLSQTTTDTGFGSDIYSVKIDGTDLRPVLKHDRANVFYASLSFDGIGNLLYFHKRMAKDTPNSPGAYLETVDEIERVDTRTGERQTVLADAAEPTVAPNGRMIVYVHIDRGQQDNLWTASTDGTKAAPFLKTGDQFLYLQAPRISPDGRQLTWSSAGRFSVGPPPTPSLAVRRGGGGRLAHLDMPSELYLAPLDGSSIRSVATTRDDVVPAWSFDSTRIAYIASSALHVISVIDGSLVTKAEGIGFTNGDPIWLR